MKYLLKALSLTIVVCLLVVWPVVGYSTLWGRGDYMVYDDVQNITWLLDANYPATSEYPKSNLTNPNLTGQMVYGDAIDWASQLDHLGYDDWRLPDATDSDESGPHSGFGAYGELGYLFYTVLGNDQYGGLRNISVEDGNGTTIIFLNIQTGPYWTKTVYVPHTEQSWDFSMGNGAADHAPKDAARWAWVVRDGDSLYINYVIFNEETVTFNGEGVVF